MAQSDRSRHERRLSSLKQERQHYESLWQDYNNFIAPGRLRLNGDERKGKAKHKHIVDETGLLAFRTLRSGMQSGQTSPARPWFRLSTFDKEMREFGPIKDYLYKVEMVMRQVMQQSNLYNVLHNGYGDLGQFGQMCALLVNDPEDYIRGVPLLTGQYWIAQNERGRVDTMYRKIPMTVEQVVGKFVSNGDGSMDWSRTSLAIKNLYDRGSYDEWVNIYHAVEPRRERDESKADVANMRYLSNYWEEGQTGDVLLMESGFNQNRILAPRWETVGSDVYAANHPGEISLPGIKMLQTEQRRKGEAIDKMVRPPMVGPTAMKNNPSSILPGSITYVDNPGNQPAYRPAFEVRFDVTAAMHDIQEVQQRIDRCWYADLFFAITQMQGVQPRNVMELSQRKEEQLLQLGPVVDRQQYELLNPIIDIVFDACVEADLLPPAPQELEGEALKIDHISLLAQAQKAVSTGAIERAIGFIGQVAQFKPEVMDKVDLDQSVDEYFDAIGAPPPMLVSDDEVKAARADREKEAAQQKQAAMMAQMAPAMKQGADAASSMADTAEKPGVQQLLAQLGLQ